MFPILIGIILAAGAVLVLRVCRIGHRPTIAAGALLAAAITVGGQHYFTYLQVQRALEKNPEKSALLRAAFPDRAPPEQFASYLRWQADQGRPILEGVTVRGAWAWASWALDALLTFAAAILLVLATARLPYCDHCRDWYRTIRSRRIEIEGAHRLAAIFDMAVGDAIRRARYRLVACPGGCDPMGLTLFWEEPGGDFSSGVLWLDPVRRQQVLQILDAPATPRAEDDANPLNPS